MIAPGLVPAAVMVGDRVSVVHGLPPDGVSVAVVVDGVVEGRSVGPVHEGRVAVRPENADPGAWLWVPVGMVDVGAVQVSPARVRLSDPDTAHAAAVRTAEQLRDQHWLVLDALVAAGAVGMLDHDHESVSGLGQDSAGKRRGELVRLGLVEASDRKRETSRKRLAIVWVVTARGRQVWQVSRRGAA